MATTIADLEVRATGDTKDAEQKLDNLGGKVNHTAADTQKAGLAFIGMGAAVAGGLILGINTAANFEQAISGVGAVANLTGSELDSVRAKAIQLGTDTTFSATEAANAMEVLLKAGMPIEDVLNGGAQAALDLAAATGTDVVTAGELITNTMNVFGDSMGSATAAADLFTAGANASASSVDSLALGFAQAAQPAKMFGFTADDLVTTLALLSKNGLQGSDAGTALKTTLLALANPSDEAKAALDGIGFSMEEMLASGDPLVYLTDKITNGTKDMTEAERNATLALIFGSDAVRVASILYNEGAEGVNNMRNEMDGQATAAEQAAARMDNLKGALETLKGTIETALIVVGSEFTPALQSVADGLQGLIGWFTELDPKWQGLIAKGAALAAGLLILAGALALAGTVMGPLAAGLAIILSPIGLIIAAIAGLAIAYQTNFLGFADAVNYVAGVLFDGAKAVFKFVGALIDAFKSGKKISDIVGDFPKPLQKFMKGILLVADAIGDLVAAWRSGGFEHMLDILPEKLRQVEKGLRIFADALLGALKAGVQMAIDYLRGIDWGAVLSAVWQGIKAIVPVIGQVLAAIPGMIGGLISSITTGFAPLDQIFEGIGQQWKGFAEVIRGIFNLDFKQVFDGLKMMLTGLGTEMIGLGNLILTGLRAGFEAAWPYVVEFVGNIPGWILTAIGAVGSWLWQKGQDFISGLNDGASDFWTNTLKPWFEGVPGLVKDAIGDVLSTLKTKGDNLLAGMKTGVLNLWNNNLKPWFSNLPTYAKNAIGDVAATLLDKGKDLLGGLDSGIKEIWGGGAGEGGGIKGWFTSLGFKILSAVGSLAGSLVQAGRDVMNGLWEGMKAVWGDITSWLGSLDPRQYKGPPERDRQMLVNAGKLIMGGLGVGLDAGWQDVTKQLMSYQPAIAGTSSVGGTATATPMHTPGMVAAAVASRAGGQGTVIYQNNTYTISIDELEDVANAAEFVRSLPTERELVFGGAFA